MLAKIGDLEAITLSLLNGKSYNFLTSLENIQDVLVDQPVDQWTLPTTTERATGKCAVINSNHLLQHFISTSTFYKHISSHEYMELSKPITESINKDWQHRYTVSQLLAGAIMIEQPSVILINCVEPYSRLKSTDTHYEWRIATAMHLSSYPEKESKYVWITVIQAQEDNTTKPKVGTITFNLLVTSSWQLGKSSSPSIRIDSNISYFAPTQNTSIYLDVSSVNLANLLIENGSAISMNQETYLHQLRQVWSKFYCLSTYTQCRSFSSIACNITFHPYIVWTLYEYDTPQKPNSRAKCFSAFFKLLHALRSETDLLLV